MKKYSILKMTAALAILMACSLSAWAQLGKIHGAIKEGYEAVQGATVSLYQDGRPTGAGAITDAKGEFEFANINPGEYEVKISWDELLVSETRSVSPGESEVVSLDLMAYHKGSDQDTVRIVGSKEIFNRDRNVSTLDRKEIGQFAGPRSYGDMIVAASPGFTQKDQGDPMNFKGARDYANATYFDGMKIRGSDQIPLGAIEQVSAMTGGIPAEYGDVLGAVIVVTTRNPSMTMGHVGKPLTRAERQQQKQLRKNGKSEGVVSPEIDGLVSL